MLVTCGYCATDAFVEYDKTTNVAVCTGPGHPTERMWEPEKHPPPDPGGGLGDGIAREYGLYDDLPECLNEGEWADTAVVEHRYGTMRPDVYKIFIARWGHVAQSPRRYSVTSFIGSTLGDLCRATNVTHKQGKGTGFFSYNPTIGLWTLEPVHDDMTTMTWERFALELGHKPGDWPLLGYREEGTPASTSD